MSCRFCDPQNLESKTIQTFEFCRVILSDPHLMPGHLLVIPTRHVERLSELDEAELNELLKTVIIFQEKILSSIASGCDIRQNCRPFLSEDALTVKHLHIHLLPREPYDELYDKCQINEKKVFETLTKNEVQTYIQTLKG